MSSTTNSVPFTAWNHEPGLYSIHHVDTDEVLDQEERVGTDDLIQCWLAPRDNRISNPNQLWQLALVTNDEWLLINKRAGTYAAAPDAECSVVPQPGHSDWPNTRWRIEPAHEGATLEVIFSTAKHPGSCLEVVNGIVKVGERSTDASGQTWYLKRHD